MRQHGKSAPARQKLGGRARDRRAQAAKLGCEHSKTSIAPAMRPREAVVTCFFPHGVRFSIARMMRLQQGAPDVVVRRC